MEMATLEDGRTLSVGHENLHNATARDREVPAAAPGVTRHRQAPVGFGLLCILLAVLIIAFILYYETMTEDKHELQKEMDTLASQYSSLTERKDKLKGIVKTPGWVYFRNSVYYISATEKTWQESREDCFQKGADLIIIDSKEEQLLGN